MPLDDPSSRNGVDWHAGHGHAALAQIRILSEVHLPHLGQNVFCEKPTRLPTHISVAILAREPILPINSVPVVRFHAFAMDL